MITLIECTESFQALVHSTVDEDEKNRANEREQKQTNEPINDNSLLFFPSQAREMVRGTLLKFAKNKICNL